jgi:large subunit ribosomal protein L21e
MGKSSGPRRKSRSALTKSVRDRGRIGLSRLLTVYEPGEKVVIHIDAGVHKGMPHRRYQGKVGTVVGRRGRAYIVEVPHSKTVTQLVALPEHLKKQ